MTVLDGVMSLLFLCTFVVIAEVIYWTSKKEYLNAKAKYLRNLIDQKNNLKNQSEGYYSCVYQKWDLGEKDLTKATKACLYQVD